MSFETWPCGTHYAARLPGGVRAPFFLIFHPHAKARHTLAFKAVLITREGERQSARLTELDDAFLQEGGVHIAVDHSAVNYKDGMVLRGAPPLIQKAPVIPGIDLAGRVTASADARFAVGDAVVAKVRG